MGTHVLTKEQLSMRIQLFLSAILFGCLLEVQSKSYLIETEDAGSKQPDEFAAVRRNLPEGKEFDSEEMKKKFKEALTEELMRLSTDDDGDGNDYLISAAAGAAIASLVTTIASIFTKTVDAFT